MYYEFKRFFISHFAFGKIKAKFMGAKLLVSSWSNTRTYLLEYLFNYVINVSLLFNKISLSELNFINNSPNKLL